MLKFTLALLASLMLPSLVQADDEKPIQPAAVKLGRPVEFERDIYPILEANCVACHNKAVNEADLILEDAAGLLKGGSSGPGIVPKKPDESYLYQVVARIEESFMPPLPNDVQAKALTPQQVGLIRQWILEGAAAGSGTRRKSLNWQPMPSQMQAVFATALDPWGRFVAAGRTNSLVVYDLATGFENVLRDTKLETVGVKAAHRDLVHGLAFHPKKSQVASSGYRIVKIWDRPDNAKVREISLPQPATAMAVHGQQTAYATADNTVRLFDAQNKQIQEWKPHTAAIKALTFSPDGTLLFSAGDDKAVAVQTVATKETTSVKITTPAPVTAIAITPDGKTLVTGHADNIVRRWIPKTAGDFATAEPTEFKGHGKPIASLVVLANGKQLLSGSADSTARLWDLNSAKATRTFSPGAPVTAVSASHDNARVAAICANGITKVWQANNGKQLFELKSDLIASRQLIEAKEQKSVTDQRVALANTAATAADKDLKDRQAAEKKAVEAKDKADKAIADPQKKHEDAEKKLAEAKAAHEAKKDDANLKKAFDAAQKAATDAANKFTAAKNAAAAADRGLKLAKQAVAKATQWLKEANDRKTAETNAQKTIGEQLAAVTKTQAQPLPAGLDVKFSTNGRFVATLAQDGIVRLWDLTAGKAFQNYEAIPGATTLAFRNGTQLLVAAQKSVEWNLNPDWQLTKRLGPSKPDTIDVADSKFEDRVVCLAYSHNGQLLATGGGEPSRNGELFLWDANTLDFVAELKDAHSDTVFAVDFSYDDLFLLSGAADKFVKQFNVAKKEYVRSFEGHTNHVMAVSWKADGATIASAGADNAIKVWNVETGAQKRTISTYRRQVTALQFLGASDNIVSGSGDKTVRLHRAANGQNYRTFSGSTDYVYSVTALRDESLVVGAGQDGTVRVWNGKDGKLLHSFAPAAPAEKQASAN